MPGYRRILFLALSLIVLGSGFLAIAQASPDDDGEVRAVREKIGHLLHKADELREAGKHDAARECVAEAEKLERRLAAHFAKAERAGHHPAELREILEGLEHGIGALKALGREEEAEHLARIAKEVRGELDGREPKRMPISRDDAKRQIEVMRMGMKAFLEKDRHDAAERLEHGVHALELALEGRTDEEAMRIRKHAPRREELAKLLLTAGEIYRGFRLPDRAEAVEKLGRLYAGLAKDEHRETDRKGPSDEDRARIHHQLEVLRMARVALREGERPDLAERVEKLIHAGELALEGGHEQEVRKTVEWLLREGDIVEVLQLASNLWRKFGQGDKAEAVANLAEQWREKVKDHPRGEEERERAEQNRRHEEERAEREMRTDRLQAQLTELSEMVEHLRRELEELRREMK
jgi:hypothetical protein